MKKSSIVITGLDYQFNKNVASVLCDKLAMFLLDVSDLMEFELAEKDEIILKCGIDYYKAQEKKIFSSLVNYENTVMVIQYDLFAFEDNYESLKSSYSFYLRFDKNTLIKSKNINIVNQIAFEERDKILKSGCNFVVNIDTDNVEDAANKILQQLSEEAL